MVDLQSIRPLQERAKELKCLYDIETVLTDQETDFLDVFNKIVQVIPSGWQFPTHCHAIIEFDDKIFFSEEKSLTEDYQKAELIVDNNIVGQITVFYKDLPYKKNAFLPEEQKLLNTIAIRLGLFIFNYRLEKTVKKLSEKAENKTSVNLFEEYKDEYWKWRFRMAKIIADKANFEHFGIQAIYLIGSTKEANAGPASDIDLLVHFIGTETQKELFKAWIDGWSYSLNEINYQHTGYKIDSGIIDLHLITDEDIKNKTSFAVMIGNIHNSAKLLKKRDE